MNHKLIGIKKDLLQLAQKLGESEQVNIMGTRAVCIETDHIIEMCRILRADAGELGKVVEEARGPVCQKT